MQKKITATWRNITTVPQLCLDYLPTVGRQMETVMVTWRVLETTGQQIIITLRLHNNNNSAKIETYFLFLCGKKMKLIHHVTSEQGIKDHGSTNISSFSV